MRALRRNLYQVQTERRRRNLNKVSTPPRDVLDSVKGTSQPGRKAQEDGPTKCIALDRKSKRKLRKAARKSPCPPSAFNLRNIVLKGESIARGYPIGIRSETHQVCNIVRDIATVACKLQVYAKALGIDSRPKVSKLFVGYSRGSKPHYMWIEYLNGRKQNLIPTSLCFHEPNLGSRQRTTMGAPSQKATKCWWQNENASGRGVAYSPLKVTPAVRPGQSTKNTRRWLSVITKSYMTDAVALLQADRYRTKVLITPP